MSSTGQMNISADKFILNFAPTGIIPTKSMNAHTPISPSEIVQDVVGAFKLGASIAHIHARDISGNPTRNPEIYKRIVGEIRNRVPEIVICVSLSSRISDDFDRLDPIRLGDEKPDMASLTVGSSNLPTGTTVNREEDIIKICDELNQLGIKPEVEAFEPGMIEYCNYLIEKSKISAPLYCNVFFGARGSAGLNASNIAAFTNNAPKGSILCAAGIGRCHKRAIAAGVALLDGVRVGIEDCPYTDYTIKTPVSNLALVDDAVKMAGLVGRTPIGAGDLRALLYSGYSGSS